jgi:lysophospholipase L1-like esterase
MSRASRARRLAVTAAAYGGGGLGVAGALATAVIVGEARLARWAIRTPKDPPPRCDGVYGGGSAEPLVLALIGDSTAAGVGAERPDETPGALLAGGLARELGRPVRLHCLAVSGATSADLYPQVESAAALAPAMAVVLIGGNDVTHAIRPPAAVRHLSRAVRRLRDAGAQVVVGTCPDLGTIRPIRQPLRWMCRRWSRELAAAQTIATVREGGRTVSLGDLLGPDFAARPDEMFSADNFHPSPTGYAKAIAAILPTVVAAMTAPVLEPATVTEPITRSLPHAAVVAARHAGTEVSAAATADGGPRSSRLVRLYRRVRMLASRPAATAGGGTMQGGMPADALGAPSEA